MKLTAVCRKIYDYIRYDLKEIAFPSLRDPPHIKKRRKRLGFMQLAVCQILVLTSDRSTIRRIAKLMQRMLHLTTESLRLYGLLRWLQEVEWRAYRDALKDDGLKKSV